MAKYNREEESNIQATKNYQQRMSESHWDLVGKEMEKRKAEKKNEHKEK